jgi:hypothetical protein
LFGFDNITTNNGWAMAAVGASIVFAGLIALSFVISQIHKLLKLWEERETYIKRFKKRVPAVDEEKIEVLIYKERHLPSVDELASTYSPLVEQLKEPFKLSQLFEIAKEMDLPHPHLSIQRLQQADILVAQGDGTFTWNK